VVVLLFEPDSDLAQMLKLLLEHAGYTVRMIADLDAAASVATNDGPAVALVDPGDAPNRWALCREIRALTGGPIVCVVPPDAAPAPEPDFYAVPSPISPRALRTLVRRLHPALVSC
jgi:hypothetical protein